MTSCRSLTRSCGTPAALRDALVHLLGCARASAYLRGWAADFASRTEVHEHERRCMSGGLEYGFMVESDEAGRSRMTTTIGGVFAVLRRDPLQYRRAVRNERWFDASARPELIEVHQTQAHDVVAFDESESIEFEVDPRTLVLVFSRGASSRSGAWQPADCLFGIVTDQTD